MKKSFVRSVRLDERRTKKWESLAQRLGTNHNRVVSMLIDNAIIVDGKPNVSLNTNRRNTQTLAGTGVAAIEA